MRHATGVGLLIAVIMLLSNTGAWAGDVSSAPKTELAATISSNAAVPWIAPTWVSLAPVVYWKIQGYWPEDWSAIKQSGLFDSPLAGINGEYFNPSSTILDFPGDVKYVLSDAGGPTMVILVSQIGVDLESRTLPKPSKTYDEYFAVVGANEQHQAYLRLIGDQDRKLLYGIRSLMQVGLLRYFSAHGRVPESFSEFVASEFSPISPDTINPLTGEPYAGDGRPNDFLYTTDSQVKYYLHMTDERGETPWIT